MFQQGMMGGSGEWWCGPGAFFPGPFGTLVTVLFWGLLLYLLVKGIQFLLPDAKRASNEEDNNATQRLNTRYAEGEINREEFQQIKKDLS